MAGRRKVVAGPAGRGPAEGAQGDAAVLAQARVSKVGRGGGRVVAVAVAEERHAGGDAADERARVGAGGGGGRGRARAAERAWRGLCAGEGGEGRGARRARRRTVVGGRGGCGRCGRCGRGGRGCAGGGRGACLVPARDRLRLRPYGRAKKKSRRRRGSTDGVQRVDNDDDSPVCCSTCGNTTRLWYTIIYMVHILYDPGRTYRWRSCLQLNIIYSGAGRLFHARRVSGVARAARRGARGIRGGGGAPQDRRTGRAGRASRCRTLCPTALDVALATRHLTK